MKWIVLIPFLFSTTAFADCAEYLSTDASHTDNFRAYVESLLQERILTNSDLQRWIEASHAEEPLGNPVRGTSASARIHAREVEKYLRTGDLDREALLNWARAKIDQEQKSTQQRQAAETETDHLQMGFVAIDGYFDYDLDFMDTPVTQGMWFDLMGKNPSYYKVGGATQPDHPVENVTWFSAAVFANRMSERAGLEPFYNFAGLKPTGRAENGDLYYADYVPQLPSVKFAEGYRLPSYNELFMLLRWPKDDIFDSPRDRDLYMWTIRNSGGHTQAVAELLPFPDLKWEIYDLLGNVQEWTDAWAAPVGGKNIRVYIGGGSFKANFGLDTYTVVRADPFLPDREIGFRLVRTVK